MVFQSLAYISSDETRGIVVLKDVFISREKDLHVIYIWPGMIDGYIIRSIVPFILMSRREKMLWKISPDHNAALVD